VTFVCVPITVHDLAQALADAQESRARGADLVEYRIDEFFDDAAFMNDASAARPILQLVRESPLPCIITCRPTYEGGAYDGDDMPRVSLYELLGTADHPPRYIDVELAAYTRSANLRQKVNLAVDHPEQRRDVRTGLVLSMHDFDRPPADLSRRVLAMCAEPAASVHKIAFRCRSLRDNLALFGVLRHKDRPTIALGMGEFGMMSRVLAPKFGAFLTFASLRPASATAPGQPTIAELIETYRFRSITPRTRVFGVVGWPVTHSMSPLVHNAGFDAVGFDGVYLPLPIAADASDPEGSYASFKATILALMDEPGLDFAGCSVTLPHKENLVRLAREQGWSLDDISDACNAANTLTIDPASGMPRVSNTDARAAIEEIARGLSLSRGVDPAHAIPESQRTALRDARVAVLGAGGVARAIVFALAAAGAKVEIYNRSLDRARALADEAREYANRIPSAPANAIAIVSAHTLEDATRSEAEVFVNATPIGMSGGPAPDAAPIDLAALDRAALAQTRRSAALPAVFDTVYNPIETPLLRDARALGMPALDGLGMFVGQAAAQFEAWTATPAPRGLFDRLVRETLSSRANRS
jgi:3-dehydroquinate dehydratase/shikimate dehydrogenase